ncbi:MAG: hypothetical protein IKU72_02135 [Oscillospiraceae bacterium]|nr:hypothetical protein [Oscillospiraceae bacterium]
MSKRKKAILISVLVFIAAVFAFLHFRPQMPLADLEADQIDTLLVHALPPEGSVILTEEQTVQAAELLRNLQVSRKGYVLLGAGGQTIKFTLIMQDGIGLEVVNFGNAVVYLNGQPYKADYQSVKPLSDFANNLIQ